MSNPTSNFGWQMPTNSDLVTDLPADFEVFGQAVDTTLADLKGGTTGQVLSKASNTDMDFTWVSDATGMTNPMTTTGDTIYSSSGSTPARLGIGSTGQVLTVSGGVPTWATASAPTTSFTQLATGSLSGGAVTVSSLSGYNRLFVKLNSVVLNNSGYSYYITLNSDTGSNYWVTGGNMKSGTTTYVGAAYAGTTTNIAFGQWGNAGGNYSNGVLDITAANSTGIKTFAARSIVSGATGMEFYDNTQGIYSGTSVISSITFTAASTTFSSGTYTIYGAN